MSFPISLGIGSPAAIPEFILFGLSPHPEVDPPLVPCDYYMVPAVDRTVTVDQVDRTITVRCPFE